MTIPGNFPVGKLNLLGSFMDARKPRAQALGHSKIQRISPFGGLPPARKPGSTFQNDARSIQARGDGTMSQFMAAKNNPQDLRTQHPPTLSTGGVGHDVASGENVNRGTGLVRDAEKAAGQILREQPPIRQV